MTLTHFSTPSVRRNCDLQNLYTGAAAVLVGGAPSLKDQPLELLSKPGTLSMAMNNAALHFRPNLWCGVDRPECFDPSILLDPGITKFGNIAHANAGLAAPYAGTRYCQAPNMYFFTPGDAPWQDYLEPMGSVPWHQNTLFTAIAILYHMGVRTIVLAGCDFSVSGKAAYAHATNLSAEELKWNSDLYASQVVELRRLSPMFSRCGLTLMDASANGRISPPYRRVSFRQGLRHCRAAFPKSRASTKTLPHCSKFAPAGLRAKVAAWPGYVCPTNGVNAHA